MQISKLSGYQTAIFLALIDGRGMGYDDEALALIEKHSPMIADHERRQFQPQAVALIITAKEATDAIVHEPTQPFTAADRAAQPTDLTPTEAYTRQAILDVIDSHRFRLYEGTVVNTVTGARSNGVEPSFADAERLKLADAVIVRLRETDKLRAEELPDARLILGAAILNPELTSPLDIDAALVSLREKLKGVGSNVVIEEVEPGVVL